MSSFASGVSSSASRFLLGSPNPHVDSPDMRNEPIASANVCSIVMDHATVRHALAKVRSEPRNGQATRSYPRHRHRVDLLERRTLPRGETNDIIEIGICPLELSTGRRLEKRSILVSTGAVERQPFCTELTTLTQEQVDGGIAFKSACQILEDEYLSAGAAVGEFRRLRPAAVREAVPRPGCALSIRAEPSQRQDALRALARLAGRGRAAAGDGAARADARRHAPPRPRRRLEHRRGAVGDAEEDARERGVDGMWRF